ncbi:NUDIX hydrolase domain protein [Kalmanozyma brasiliensis GHG001]|uniref:Nudix hydrolase domain-containing protein n=1 Tax=Kalmanozyma brasiliensis (strain GHG001) TaxID=1365824 RepID=V5ETB7_KALBG|nr:NUDIX hydrolase domain protein [Kalmanozyma brasiliensis GHG001]EST05239.1 NUDIX hydrolase domain protein [Kalmanozyma brasiliensis GHG001]
MASAGVHSNSAILTHLSHALLRISRIPPRVIASPPTQPRRASVAILLRVRPTAEDEAWLAQNHDPEAQHAATTPSGDPSASHELGNSGVHVSQASLGAGTASLASSVASGDLSSTLSTFFDQPWVQRGTPEILYIKRAARIGDNWSAHVAFPGGRKEEGDENGLYTAMRETWEEVGIDLAEKEFSCVGQLDDREITTSLGKRLLMVLSPYVFVQTSPFSPLPDLQPSEVASAHWVPLGLLYTPKPKWGTTSVDISSRLAPKSPLVRWVLRALVGKMDFKCILLPNDPVAVAEYEEEDEGDTSQEKPGSHIARTEEGVVRPDLRLWGLTLGMTLDLLSHMTTYESNSSFRSGGISPTTPTSSWSNLPSPPPLRVDSSLPSASELVSAPLVSANRVISRVRDEFHLNPPPASHALAPSLTSVFPRFSYPDVNFWIWFFGWRYRTVVRGWEGSVGTRMERKFNWSGMALGAFYSAVRRALVVAVVLRALGMVSAGGVVGWLLARKAGRMRRGQQGWGLDELLR